MYPVYGLPVVKGLPLSRIFQARLLREWWDTHPMAGPPDGSAPPDELPAMWAGEFGAVLLACGVAVPTGAVRVVWEMALDRVPPATLTFSKPKAWLVRRMRVHKGKCYKLAREGTA